MNGLQSPLEAMPLSDAYHYRIRYSTLRNEYGLLSFYVEELREIILKAALHDQLTGVQRDELLAVVEEIDEERKALKHSP